MARCLAMAGLGLVLGLALGPTPAAAHPLGNFSVNHYHGLRLYPDRLDDIAVLDEAEMPTLQGRYFVDDNADGTITDSERAMAAAANCRAIANDLYADVDGQHLLWTVVSATLRYRPGASSLETSRTECHLSTRADLRPGAIVSVTDTYRGDRIGWHEITAVGDGIGLRDPPVPATSVTDELRRYPRNRLAAPLDQRTVRLWTVGFPSADPAPPPPGGAGLTDRFYAVAGSSTLTPTVGLLGVALALLFGAGQAALPGHGKTAMVAYLVARRGRPSDALTVGATVTATHTVGVLVLWLAGEVVLAWLGLASGLLVAAIGAGLVRSGLRDRRTAHAPATAGPAVEVGVAPAEPVGVASVGVVAASVAPGREIAVSTRKVPAAGTFHAQTAISPEVVGTARATHTHARSLVGLGVVGGLVPSPSALVVLLGAAALGRTWFGVVLVVAYSVGMAVTLTAVGLAPVVLRGRLPIGRTWVRWLPLVTAGLAVVVGVGLALRSALALP